MIVKSCSVSLSTLPSPNSAVPWPRKISQSQSSDRTRAAPLTAGRLNRFLQDLPALGDDAEAFAQDVRRIRAEFPAEADSWD
jgi:hypothetical protein